MTYEEKEVKEVKIKRKKEGVRERCKWTDLGSGEFIKGIYN